MVTDRGWAALGASLALIVLWVILGEVELLGLALLLILACGVALALVRRWRPEVIASRRLIPNLVHEGETAAVQVAVRNRGRRSLFNLVLEDEVSELGAARFVGGRLAAGETVAASYQIVCKPRGVYEVGPARVTTGDPLGLARAAATAGEGDRLIVYPRVEDLGGLPIARGLNPSTHAVKPEFTHRGGEDFFTLREYQTGDDLRRVHWPSSAKRDELMIRQLETPWQSRALVLLDTRAGSYESSQTFEKAVSGAASVVRHLHGSEFEADLWAGDMGVVGSDPGAYAAGMETLALVRTVPALDLRGLATRLRGGSRGGALILVTGIPDRELLAVDQLLSRDYRATILMVAAEAPPASIVHFQRAGAVTVVVRPDQPWASAWLGAMGATWSTVSAG